MDSDTLREDTNRLTEKIMYELTESDRPQDLPARSGLKNNKMSRR
jgi:hypothetical protein